MLKDTVLLRNSRFDASPDGSGSLLNKHALFYGFAEATTGSLRQGQ